ncbi:hypothetical protein HDU76_010452, partial [Blyttiomyces sp. JEL0837]
MTTIPQHAQQQHQTIVYQPIHGGHQQQHHVVGGQVINGQVVGGQVQVVDQHGNVNNVVNVGGVNVGGVVNVNDPNQQQHHMVQVDPNQHGHHHPGMGGDGSGHDELHGGVVGQQVVGGVLPMPLTVAHPVQVQQAYVPYHFADGRQAIA